jgi:hypothetical protein
MKSVMTATPAETMRLETETRYAATRLRAPSTPAGMSSTTVTAIASAVRQYRCSALLGRTGDKAGGIGFFKSSCTQLGVATPANCSNVAPYVKGNHQ